MEISIKERAKNIFQKSAPILAALMSASSFAMFLDMGTTNFMLLVFFILLVPMYRNAFKIRDRRVFFTALVCGLFYAAAMCFFNIGWFTAITLIITFCMIDMFDTIGTLVGTASRAGMVDENGNMPNMKEALLADAIGTVAGSVSGTSTVTTFIESASGVEAGGRTGLTALTTGIMFLACIFIAPIAAIIPAAATSSALIYVGILMLAGLKNINFDDIAQTVPVALMLIAMPISGSIGHAIGLGLISYTIIRIFTGKAKEVSVLTYVISALFLLKFFVVA